MVNVRVFKKWLKLLGQGQEVKSKGLVIKNTHTKYKSSITYHLQDIANVIFADRQTGQKLSFDTEA
jgi:hypothetical protein